MKVDIICSHELTSNPDVSICIVTYNQAPFIEKCIQSVLMQEVNFSYEIVVGEDGSQDETPQILKRLQAEHPDKIRLFLNHTNMGRKGGNNFQRTLKACTGRYIAQVDGDDYWINPTKLQQQYDFLESHPDYVICFHNVQAVDEKTGQLLEINPVAPDTMTLKEVCTESYIHTSTNFFRNVLGPDIDEWLDGEDMAQDWPLQIYLAQYGKAKFI
ncbi:MAG: glycosyltransferase, partial [Cyanobacteria bacterium]|nr:glycosyltransferase [Cyanobacteriota bacterium]